jgi:Cu(I)/Ag(I) efflux system membrane fusion protein
MTMGFKVSSTGLQRNIGIGDRVAFDIQQGEDGSFEIVAIAPTSGAPKPEINPWVA